jgi:rhomboid protease GluP
VYPPDNQYPQTPPPGRYVTVKLPTVRPFVTYVIMGLTILVFLLQMLSQPLFGGDLPAALGAKVNELIMAGEFWRLFTPMLLHGGILHILFNMYALYAFGPELERAYGHWRFLALYILGGFAGNVFSFLFTPGPSLGSSTAIFGLLGAEGVFLFRNRKLFGAGAQRALTNVVMVALLNLGLGAAGSGIDNWGHLGGLLGGTFFAWFAGPVYELEDDYYNPKLVDAHGPMHTALAWIAGFIVFAALVAMKLFR